MKESKIKWLKGEGYITARYVGEKNGELELVTDENIGVDREQAVTVQSASGDAATITVRQDGKRIEYATQDNEVYITADGMRYTALKDL